MVKKFELTSTHTNLTSAAFRKINLAGSVTIITGLLGMAGCGAEPPVIAADEVKELTKPNIASLETSAALLAGSDSNRIGPSPETSETISMTCANQSSGDIRCLHNYDQYAKSDLLNKVGRNVAVEVVEFHSTCGLPGHRVGATRRYTVNPYETIDVDFYPHTVFGCREQWIINCKLDVGAGGYIPVRCSDVLIGWMIIDYR